MKKILVVLMMLCMMAGMAEAATEGDWEYYRKYDANNTAYITKYTGTSESVVIPTELGGYTVSTIGDGYNSPFKECSSLKSVVIPDGFTSIGSSAFRDCSSLTSVDIPEGVASIGSNAFYGCSNLTDIVIPDGVTSIGSEAFYNCSSLTNISIPDGVTTIGSSAFSGCGGLTSVVIPDGVTNIGNSAFRDCSKLTSIIIPDGVTSIGSQAFYNCSSLTSIVIPDGVTDIGSSTFYNCSSLTSVSIPDGVTSIGSNAFYGCSSLMSIDIPESVVSIGSGAFWYCSNLKSVIIPDGVTSIEEHLFNGCTHLTDVVIPQGVTSIGTGVFINCINLVSIDIPESVTSIGWSAFQSCKKLESIDIPPRLEELGQYAFSGCESLKSITLPDDMKSIGNGTVGVVCYCHIGSQTAQLLGIASSDNKFCDTDYPGLYFSYEYNQDEKIITGLTLKDADETITEARIPDGVTRIGEYAFYNCTKLISVEMLDNVTSIDTSAFYNCKKLESIELPNTVRKLGYNVFSGCESLKSVTLPDDMTTVNGEVGVVCYCHLGSQTAQLLGIASGYNLFCDENYPGLYFSYDYDRDEKVITGLTLKDADETITTAQIPVGVTVIGSDAFYKCSSLTNVVLPNSLSSIDYGAFRNCSSLVEITVPGGVTSIGSNAFSDCKQLSSIVLPPTLTSLGDSALYGCTSLASYTLPDNITDIGTYVHNEDTTVCFCTLGSPASYALSKGHSTFADPAYDKLVFRYIYDDDSATFTGLELVRAQKSITEAVIPDGVTVIGYNAFSDCASLLSVSIPDSVDTIKSNAFCDCPNLPSVTLPDHVTKIASLIIEDKKTVYCSWDSDTARAISAESKYSKFMDPQYPEYWFSYTYNGDSITGLMLKKAVPYLVTAVIPYFVTDIEELAFVDCTQVKSVVLPDGLKTIGKGAFVSCDELEEINIPDGVISIGRLAFAFSHPHPIKAYIPASVNEIGGQAFPPSAKYTTIYCYQYSYAQSWGNQNNVTVVLLDGKDFKSAGGTVSMPQTLYVGNGRSKTIAAEIFPKMNGLNITWKSSNTDVATVSSQGVLTAKKNGKTTVTLSVDGITARSAVTVVTPATDFTIPADVFVEAGKATDAPAPVVYPSDAKLDLTWEVADTVIAEVSGDGKITSHVVGETTITATDSVTGLRRSATLHTIRPVTSIVLQPATLTLLPYQGAQLSAIVSADAFQFENQLVTFTSSNKKVATVDENGWVQAKGAGTAIITAVSENNIRATSQVTVSKATVLKLPSALRTIQANAFSGVAAEVVVLPAGVESIGDGAFANLSGLKLVVVPEAAAQAAKDAFAGTQAVLVRPDGREINPQ